MHRAVTARLGRMNSRGSKASSCGVGEDCCHSLSTVWCVRINRFRVRVKLESVGFGLNKIMRMGELRWKVIRWKGWCGVELRRCRGN